MSENRCVCCGLIIPEGQQVCPLCQKEAKEKLEEAERSLKSRSTISYIMNEWVIPLGIGILIILIFIKISNL